MASTDYIPNCPHCDSPDTTVTPGTGLDGDYHCLRCDRRFKSER